MASLKYFGESLFILSTVASLVRWIGRTLRETIPPSHAELSLEMELPRVTPVAGSRGKGEELGDRRRPSGGVG
jgi:hypothetical protein